MAVRAVAATVVVVLAVAVVTTEAATAVSEQYDNNRTTAYCDVTTCKAATRRSRSARLAQRALDTLQRQLDALRNGRSSTQVYGVTAVFPSRVRASGGDVITACGFGFAVRNVLPGRGGSQEDSRIFCNFRLNQTAMAAMGREMGVVEEAAHGHRPVSHDFEDHSPLIAQAGIYKRGSLRPMSPGHVQSFRDRLTAVEAHYSQFLTTPATQINDGEVLCPFPDVTAIPIGWPQTAQVTISINGKEQFHQLTTALEGLRPTVIIYDDRFTKDGRSTVHDSTSRFGRAKEETFADVHINDEIELSVTRNNLQDLYPGDEHVHSYPFQETSRGAL